MERSASAQFDAVIKEKQKVGRPSKAFWRGSLMGGCLRAHWYDSTGVPPSEPFDDKILRVFERGHAVSEWISTVFANAPGLVEYKTEVPVEIKDYEFAGNIDAVVKWSDGTEEVWEFKSTKATAFKWLKDEPKPEHATQAALYAIAMQKADGIVRPARVIYINADDFSMREYIVSDDMRARAWRTLKVARAFKDQNRMPPQLPIPDDKTPNNRYPCSYCRYRTECRG
ncbi:cas4, CRISPR-associated protein Cas4 [uncultured Caudovirales phage]|uniref:Cas4, CRISPR-associated protein Cas4 n=1 Tax=uncultured Caudovirales phage TaxID=2100421 RepID=A0A6J5Q597_9CAUD|nr:cas4, CRISPR-associated protein Cas4 [uncultured Caudovirales phage]CAB4199919.1 cas4, CRISPR-associated protein Cas4 [uncultured Caudovirales phage]CAB4218306.1 cas4, CRISPR-associated protein Cas4 [uncultured Caudovirales phage]